MNKTTKEKAHTENVRKRDGAIKPTPRSYFLKLKGHKCAFCGKAVMDLQKHMEIAHAT